MVQTLSRHDRVAYIYNDIIRYVTIWQIILASCDHISVTLLIIMGPGSGFLLVFNCEQSVSQAELRQASVKGSAKGELRSAYA